MFTSSLTKHMSYNTAGLKLSIVCSNWSLSKYRKIYTTYGTCQGSVKWILERKKKMKINVWSIKELSGCAYRWLCPRLLTSMMENRPGVNNVGINQPEINPLIVQERGNSSAGLNHANNISFCSRLWIRPSASPVQRSMCIFAWRLSLKMMKDSSKSPVLLWVLAKAPEPSAAREEKSQPLFNFSTTLNPSRRFVICMVYAKG